VAKNLLFDSFGESFLGGGVGILKLDHVLHALDLSD